MKKNKGFTLIELMVTIAVLAIIAGIAAPSFSNFIERYNYKKSYESVVVTLKEARSKAASERAVVVVCVGVTSEDTCLTAVGVDSIQKAMFKNSKRVLLVPLQAGIVVTGHENIVFSPTGSSQSSFMNSLALNKKIVLCQKKKSKEILVSKLGGISIGVEGACS